jgi:hypothetical protein
VHGAIKNDFGLDVEHGEYVGHGLNGQIGNGGPRIKLSNVNGAISIKRAQDGKKLSAAVSLQSDKAKEKDKLKELAEARRAAAAQRAQNAEDRLEAQQAAEEQRRATRQLRESQREIQREVEQAIREAQREIERAQREIQLETERQVRKEMRMENRGIGRGTGRGSGRGRGEGVGDARLLDRESKSFAVSGQARVNVGTFDGAVTVRGWDKAEVMYTATKRAGTEEELKQIAIQSEQQGSRVSIIARSDGSGSAAVDVYVPRSAKIHVSSDDGQLNIGGVSGRLTLRTGNGSIQVSDCKGQLEANTGDGYIRIANFDGQVDAHTGAGAIALEGKFTELSARTGDGSITLAVPTDSNFTVETNAEAISNEGLNVSEDIAPSPRLKRWRVGRGGQVFVLTTGDGKIVLRNQ